MYQHILRVPTFIFDRYTVQNGSSQGHHLLSLKSSTVIRSDGRIELVTDTIKITAVFPTLRTLIHYEIKINSIQLLLLNTFVYYLLLRRMYFFTFELKKLFLTDEY